MKAENLNENIKIIQGDCLEFMKTLKDQSVDLILTDPPYAGAGMPYDEFDDSDIEKVNNLVLEFLKEAKRVAKIIIFPSGNYETEKLLFKTDPPAWRICWNKGVTSSCSPVGGFRVWEMMMVYGEKAFFNHQHDHFTAVADERKGNYGFPCPKPIKWADWLISRFSNENDLVLDCFMGSGTVGVVCARLERRFIGVEISEKYCQISRERIKNELAQLRMNLIPRDTDKQIFTLHF